MSFDLTMSQALAGALTPGTPVNLDLSIPGQFAYYSFTAAAGETFSVDLSSIVTSPAGVNVWFAVIGPNGQEVTHQTPYTNGTIRLPNLAAGTYKAFVVGMFGIPLTAQLTASREVTGALTLNDTPTHFSTASSGQSLAIAFAATSGTTVALASTNMVTSPTSVSGATFYVYAPNGSIVGTFTGNRTSNPGDSYVFNVTQTGTYKVYVVPTGSGTLSFDLNVSTPFTGTVVKGGGPLAVNMGRPGQFGLMQFTATAGQSLTVNFTSVTTTPASIHLWIDLVNPGGSIIATAHGTGTTRQINLGGLGAGTYTIYIWPTQAVTTSMNIEIP
jgi:hypothetical protein